MPLTHHLIRQLHDKLGPELADFFVKTHGTEDDDETAPTDDTTEPAK